MKNLFFILTFAAALSACSSTECLSGTCSDVDTTIKYTPSSDDYIAQGKKQTYVSPKGSSTKKPTAVKKDTVVVVQKIVVVKEVVKKEVAPVAKKETAKKPKATKNTETAQPQLQMQKEFNGEKPYNAILF